MIVILDKEVDNAAVRYTLNTLLGEFLRLDLEFRSEKPKESDKKKSITLYYGYRQHSHDSCDIEIYCNNLWSNKVYLKSNSLPEIPLKRYKDDTLKAIIDSEDLPVIYSGVTDDDQLFIKKTKKEIKTNIDVIASSFFMLSRYEEYINPKVDEHSRFLASESIAYKDNFLDRPIVNEYLELLWTWIKHFDSSLKKPRRNFNLFLTHDIDELKLWTFRKKIRYTGRLLIKQKSLKKFFKYFGRIIAWIFTSKKNTFKYICAKSRKFGFKSHFYFLINGTARYDNRIDYQSPKFEELIRYLEDEGHEIGLHPSYSSYLNEKQLMKEKNILNSFVRNKNYGVRSHYLRFKVPESFRILEKCGFPYDTTLTYAERDGFRTGCCYPYKPFDLETNKLLDVIEYPLITMDATLTSSVYLNLSRKETKQTLIERIDKIAFFKGTFVFLIHNASLEELEFRWRRIYEKVLKHCKSKEGRN